MSRYTKYSDLISNPPNLVVVDKPREMKINLISCMCDNEHRWTIKKNEDGDYRIHTHGYSYSNWQIPHRKDDIEWVADDGDWEQVFRMINEGTSKIESIKYR